MSFQRRGPQRGEDGAGDRQIVIRGGQRFEKKTDRKIGTNYT